VGDDVIIDSEMLLMTDFVNLKIKLTQSFRYIHESRMCECVCVHMGEYLYIYKYLHLYCIS
jgi:hypothetical protein